MGDTKIINIQKEDSLEDVLEVFHTTPAREVILIFPRGSHFARSTSALPTIRETADELGKTVSVMSTDPQIAKLAEANGLELLATAAIAPSRKMKPVADWQPITADDPEKDAQDEDETGEETEPEADGRENDDDSSGVETLAATANSPAIQLAMARRKTVSGRPGSEGIDNYLNIAKVWARPPESGQGLPKRRRRTPKIVAIISGAIALIVFAVLYNYLAKAKVIIIPKMEKADFQFKLSASTTQSILDAAFNRMPGQLVSAQADASDFFTLTTTKNVVQKAGGKITIYNQGLTEQRLVATTRFESPTGLIFRIPTSITVPGGHLVNGKIAPGTIESPVYADRPGTDYNIAAARFTIPGFKDTPRHDQFYALSNGNMTGGFVGTAKVVGEDDYLRAQTELSQTVKARVLSLLQQQAGGLKILDAVAVSIDKPTSNVAVGVAAEQLTMTLHGSAQTIAFRADDVNQLVLNHLAANGDWQIIPKKTDLIYQDPIFNAATKTLSFTIKIGGVVAKKINAPKIAQEIAGMNAETIRNYFNAQPVVDSANVILSPFWVKRIPRDLNKVMIEIKLD